MIACVPFVVKQSLQFARKLAHQWSGWHKHPVLEGEVRPSRTWPSVPTSAIRWWLVRLPLQANWKSVPLYRTLHIKVSVLLDCVSMVGSLPGTLPCQLCVVPENWEEFPFNSQLSQTFRMAQHIAVQFGACDASVWLRRSDLQEVESIQRLTLPVYTLHRKCEKLAVGPKKMVQGHRVYWFHWGGSQLEVWNYRVAPWQKSILFFLDQRMSTAQWAVFVCSCSNDQCTRADSGLVHLWRIAVQVYLPRVGILWRTFIELCHILASTVPKWWTFLDSWLTLMVRFISWTSLYSPQ